MELMNSNLTSSMEGEIEKCTFPVGMKVKFKVPTSEAKTWIRVK